MLVLPDQIVNELPALNECKITNKIGMNKNTKTSTVQTAKTLFKTSRLTRVCIFSLRTCAADRSCSLRRICCTTGAKILANRGTSQTIAAPMISDIRTAPIIKIAIAEPSGQFCAPLNCEAIIEPIMFPLAPPKTVAVT